MALTGARRKSTDPVVQPSLFNNRAGTIPSEEVPARLFFMAREKQTIKEPSATPNENSVPPQQLVVETAVDSRTFWIPKSVLAGTAGLLVVALIYFWGAPSSQPEIQQFGRTRAIQLDVQNGAGESKLAQKLTEYLRAEGFDVVEMGNYKSSNVPETMVIDRAGNIDAAKSVAVSLGIAEERVVQQLDRNLFLDVTVVIGKDFASLKAFQ